MKKILLFLVLLYSAAAMAQAPNQVLQPQYFLKWIKVKDSVRAPIVFIGTNDTAATQAYVRSFVSGGLSLIPGYGIRISGDSIILDSASYRKQDSMYVVTDSTFIIKINGSPYAFKMRGAIFSFAGRNGAIIPLSSDYSAFYPLLTGAYNNPTWINTLAFSKMTGTPLTLEGYGIGNAVFNTGGGFGWGSGGYSSRPVEGKYGNFYYANDSGKIYWDDGANWQTVTFPGGGSGTITGTLTPGAFPYAQTTTQMAGAPLINDTTNGRIKFNVPIFVNTTGASIFDKGTTAQRPGSPVSGMIRFNTDSAGYEQYNGAAWAKFGSNAPLVGSGTVTSVGAGFGIGGGTITSSGTHFVDTTAIIPFTDTTFALVTRTFLNTRGFLTTETDPVANVKNITINQGSGITVTGTAAQTLGSNPVWSFKADTTLLVTATMLGKKTTVAGTAGNLTYLTANGGIYTAPIINDTTNSQVTFNSTLNFQTGSSVSLKMSAASGATNGINMIGTTSGAYGAIVEAVGATSGLVNQFGNGASGAGAYESNSYLTNNGQSVSSAWMQAAINNAYVQGIPASTTSNRFTFGWVARTSFNNTFSNVTQFFQYDSLGRWYSLKSPRTASSTDSVLTFTSGTGEFKMLGRTQIPVVHAPGTIWNIYPSGPGDTIYDKGNKASSDIWARTGTDSANFYILRANGVTPGSYTTANITIDSAGRVTAASNGSGGSSYTFAQSVSNSGGTVTLANDNLTPGNYYFYMTNASGTKGWFPYSGLPTQLKVVNAGGAGAGLDSFATSNLNHDSLIITRQDLANLGGILITKTGSTVDLNKYNFKFDTSYAAFQTYVALHGGGGSSDSLKHLFVDTAASCQGCVLTFNKSGRTWNLTAPFTSVTAGLGMTGGTITTAGTLGADTTFLMTKGSTQTISGLKNFTGGMAINNLVRPISALAPKLGALVEDTTTGTVYRQSYQAIDTTGIVDGAFVQWNAAAGNFKVQSNSGFGTVIQVTAPSGLSPLFTTSVATNTTTPVISFALTNAAAHKFWGNFTGSTGAPSYSTPILASADFPNQGTTVTVLHGNAAGSPSWGAVNLNTDVTGTLMAAQFPALIGDISTTAGSLTTAIGAGKVTNTMLAGSIDLATKMTGLLAGVNGGTGVNNSGKTITLGGNLTTSGAFGSTFTMTGTTAVTFPTSGTLLTTTGSGATLTSIPLTIAGTANQIIASSSTGNITLSTPQAIAPGSSPTFTGLTLTGLGTGANTDNIVNVTSGGVLNKVSLASLNGQISQTIFTGTADKAATNTTAVVSLVPTGVGIAIPANSLSVGKTIHVRIAFSVTTTGTGGAQWGYEGFNGSYTSQQIFFNAPLTNNLYYYDQYLTVRSTGSSGTLQGYGILSNSGGTVADCPFNGILTAGINTTIANTPEVNIQWDATGCSILTKFYTVSIE